jgi:hypothetical protein
LPHLRIRSMTKQASSRPGHFYYPNPSLLQVGMCIRK